MDSDLIRGHVDTIILNILAMGDKYGYEIIDEVQKKSQGNFELKQPTLYSCLNRMEKNGLISSYWLDSDIGGKRHYYKLTELGRETFEDNQRKWVESRNIINQLIFNSAYTETNLYKAQTPTPQITTNNDEYQTDNDSSENIEELEDSNEELTDNSIEDSSSPITSESDINNENVSDDVVEKSADNDIIEESNTDNELFFTTNSDSNEYKQTTLFNGNELNNKPDLKDEEERLLNFFEIADKKASQNEEQFSEEPMLDTSEDSPYNTVNESDDIDFDLSSYYSVKNNSFYSASNKGNAVEPDYNAKRDGFSSTEISPEEIPSFTSKLDDEAQNKDNEPISYFDINFDDDEEEDSPLLNVKYEENDNDNNTTYSDSNDLTLNESISPIADENKEADSEDALKEETSESSVINTTNNKESNDLYNRVSSLKDYKPRYTDADYKEILGGLTSYSNSFFSKPNYNEPIETNETKIKKNFESTKESLEKEGISVRLHSKYETESPDKRSYILSNKIKFINSWITFCMMAVLLAITYLVAKSAGYIGETFASYGIHFIVAIVALLAIPVTFSIIYYTNPTKKRIPRYSPKYSTIFAILFAVQALLLVYSFNITFGFYSFTQTNYNHLNWLVPSVVSLVIPFSSIFYTILFKSKKFHV